MSDELEKYIIENEIDAEIVECGEETRTAEQAAKFLGISPDNIVKDLVFLADGEPILVLISGSDRVDLKKLKKILQVRNCWIAGPGELENITGYSPGEVPPLDLDMKTILDERLAKKNLVYAGGGSKDKLLKISLKTIIEETNPMIVDISE